MADTKTSFAQGQLRGLVERIERLEEEKKTIAADIKEVYAEAKGNGFDTKVLRKVVSLRKKDRNEREDDAHLAHILTLRVWLGVVNHPDYYAQQRDKERQDVEQYLHSFAYLRLGCLGSHLHPEIVPTVGAHVRVPGDCSATANAVPCPCTAA